LLLKRDFEKIIFLCNKNVRAFKFLRSCLYDVDSRIYWSAIEAIAKLMQVWWQENKKEKVREFIRNLFWSMNDESGGIGWNAPQTIAEIIIHIPQLLEPYGSMMVAHAFEEPSLVKGGLWGIGRLGERIKDSVSFFQNEIFSKVLKINEPETLGLFAWAMGEVSFKPALPYLKKLLNCSEKVKIYVQGKFWERRIAEWAKEAVKKIEK
ncbi:MAG: hypothetical protein LWW95_09425, partial [Candidatus Desulfofervidus auxilii]|nr:hypothetical protein [Candidatus Desulfofervidus auxilii]